MLYFRIKITILLCIIFAVSCGLADLRPVGISIKPDKNTVLPAADTPVILKFDTKMIKNDAEGLLQISSDSGVVQGDRFWKGNDLYFVPVPGWTAGVRYTLTLSGIIRAIDGRELRIEKFISFYAINKNVPPLLVLFTPADGESTGINNITLEFNFSRSMERLSVETALNVDGIGNKTFEWSADDSILNVVPDRPLPAWTLIRWTLRETALSRDGIPLPKTYSGQFITDKDNVLPRVERVFPVTNTDGIWYPVSVNLDIGPAVGQGIAVEFTKTMDENVLRSLRFEPSLSGRTELLSEKSIVYIFSRDPEPKTIYTLIVSGDTRDSEGLKIGEDFKINFTPDIPFLEIISINADSGDAILDFSLSNNVLKVRPDPATGRVYLTFNFSLFFNSEEKKNSPLKISLNPLFPQNLPPIALNDVYWISDDRLRLGWEGLRTVPADNGGIHATNYYKLTIPGGRSGINSETGIYMKEDITIYLEVIE